MEQTEIKRLDLERVTKACKNRGLVNGTKLQNST